MPFKCNLQRYAVVDAPTSQSWTSSGGMGGGGAEHPRRRAGVVRALIEDSHVLSRAVGLCRLNQVDP